jgi:hypothetical protein
VTADAKVMRVEIVMSVASGVANTMLKERRARSVVFQNEKRTKSRVHLAENFYTRQAACFYRQADDREVGKLSMIEYIVRCEVTNRQSFDVG